MLIELFPKKQGRCAPKKYEGTAVVMSILIVNINSSNGGFESTNTSIANRWYKVAGSAVPIRTAVVPVYYAPGAYC